MSVNPNPKKHAVPKPDPRYLVDKATDIVTAAIHAGKLRSTDDILDFIKKVTISLAFNPAQAEEQRQSLEEPTPMIEDWRKLRSPYDSIRKTYVICLECGKRYKMLTHRHTYQLHGLTVREYKKKHGMLYGTSLKCLNLQQSQYELSRANYLSGIGLGKRHKDNAELNE